MSQFRSHSAASVTTITSSNHHPARSSNFSYESLKKNINGINGLEDALSLYNEMIQMRPLPKVIHFNQLLNRNSKMKHFSSVVSVFRDMCASGNVLVCEYTMGTTINHY